MNVVSIDQRARLRAYLQRRAALHLYELGDLDEFFWPSTRWFGLEDRDELHAVVLLYASPGLATVIALGDADELTLLGELLAAIRGELPARFHAHLSCGLVDALAPHSVRERRGLMRMVLTDRSAVGPADDPQIVPLGVDDRDELSAFYARSYPGNWFDARMLETRQYVGIRDPALVAAAGIHVYAPAEGVAALGNIAVAPDRRGEGLGPRVTAAVCRSLAATVDTIGLNVRADNAAAIRCYTRLGFAPFAEYEECLVTMAEDR